MLSQCVQVLEKKKKKASLSREQWEEVEPSRCHKVAAQEMMSRTVQQPFGHSHIALLVSVRLARRLAYTNHNTHTHGHSERRDTTCAQKGVQEHRRLDSAVPLPEGEKEPRKEKQG